MKKIIEIFVVLENRPSTLGELCSQIAESGMNIESIGVFQDIAKIWVKNATKAAKALKKKGYEVEVREVLKLDLENRAGSLAEVTSKLGNRGINIEYCYGTLTQKADSLSVILDVPDVDKAIEILKS